jgi:hypothetical protein
MSELDDYGKDKLWIMETLKSLTEDTGKMKSDITEMKIQINTVTTRMGVILTVIMILLQLAPRFFSEDKNETKTNTITPTNLKPNSNEHSYSLTKTLLAKESTVSIKL